MVLKFWTTEGLTLKARLLPVKGEVISARHQSADQRGARQPTVSPSLLMPEQLCKPPPENENHMKTHTRTHSTTVFPAQIWFVCEASYQEHQTVRARSQNAAISLWRAGNGSCQTAWSLSPGCRDVVSLPVSR